MAAASDTVLLPGKKGAKRTGGTGRMYAIAYSKRPSFSIILEKTKVKELPEWTETRILF